MKKVVLSLLLALSLLLPLCTALSDAQTDWNRECTLKLSGAAAVYTWSEAISTPSDLSGGELKPSGNLPAGTYVKRIAPDKICTEYNMAHISYYSGNSVRSGYVDSSLVVPATATVTLTNGSKVKVPEALTADQTVLEKYLWANYPDAMNGYSDRRIAAPQVENDPDHFYLVRVIDQTPDDLYDDAFDLVPVQLETLGLAWSCIRTADEVTDLRTAELLWPCVAEENEHIACINAPKSGKVTLYPKASKHGKGIGKIDAGKLVLVLKKGTNFTRVWADGTIGYVMTAALDFYGVSTDDEYADDTLAKNGSANGRASIGVRLSPKSAARTICKYPTGTPIVVFNDTGAWAEIDVDGYHGFIQSKFRLME